MTFRKSSTKPLISDFRHSFRIGIVPSVFASAILIMFLNNYGTLKYYIENMARSDFDEYRYFFFEMSYLEFPVKALLFAFGMAMGVMAFLFVNSKKMSNVFFSLNIKRSSMFINRCISSIIYIFLAVLIPMIYFLLVNIHFLGFEPVTLVPWFYLLIALFTHALIGFAVAVLAAVCSGSFIESGIFSVIFLLSPLMLLYTIEMLLGSFLHGYPVLLNMVRAGIGWPPATIYKEIGIYNRYAFLNPLNFLAAKSEDIFLRYDGSRLSILGSMLKGGRLNIGIGDYGPIFFWLAISVGLLIFAAFVLNRRKAENAGSFGKNKVARAYVSGLSSIFIFSAIVSYFSTEPLKAVLFGVVAFVLVYFIFELIILRSFREVREGLIKLPIMLGALLLISVILLTGGFSYSKKIPAASEVEGIEISSISGGNLLYDNWNYDFGIGLFTSEKDIDMLLSLHQDLIDEGYVFKRKLSPVDSKENQTGYYVQYKLKDGTSLERFYQLEGERLKEAIVSVGDSDYTKALLEEFFLMTPEQIEETYGNGDDYHYRSYEYQSKVSLEEYRWYDKFYNVSVPYSHSSGVLLASKDLNGFKKALVSIDGADENQQGMDYDIPQPVKSDLTSDELQELKQCIYNDYLRLGAEKILYPTEKVLGSVIFNNQNRNMYYSTHEFASYRAVDFENDMYIVQFTEDMTESLAFLEENELMDLFESDVEIVSAGILKSGQPTGSFYELYWRMENFGKSSVSSAPLFFFDSPKGENWDEVFESMNAEVIKDKDKIDELFENSYMSYIADGDALPIMYVMSDNSCIFLCLPGDKVVG